MGPVLDVGRNFHEFGQYGQRGKSAGMEALFARQPAWKAIISNQEADTISFDIPQRWEPQIEQIAQAQHISTDEALDRVIEAGVEKFQLSSAVEPRVSYASLYGSVKGPGAHGSREAVDRYLAELRSEW